MSMEAGKSKSAVIFLKPNRDSSVVPVWSRCRPRKTDGTDGPKAVYQRLFPITPGKVNLVILLRPSTDQMMPTHIIEGNWLTP